MGCFSGFTYGQTEYLFGRELPGEKKLLGLTFMPPVMGLFENN
jgi:hypothetical protein